MPQHLPTLSVLVVGLAAVLVSLTQPATTLHFVKRLAIVVAFLLALMAAGAVAGKTLGDFLRNVNG